MGANLGQGSLALTPRTTPQSAGGITGANNGLSSTGTDAQLGQDLGAIGDPAALLNNRKIPLSGFSIDWLGNIIEEKLDDTLGQWKVSGINEASLLMDDANKLLQFEVGAGLQFLYIDPLNSTYWIGDIPGAIDSTYFYLDNLGFEISSNGRSICGVDNDLSTFGEFASDVYLRLLSTPGSESFILKCVNGIRIDSNSAILLKMFNPLINGAGASVGTLNNAPVAGDPTKWIAIDDGGTIRHIPAW